MIQSVKKQLYEFFLVMALSILIASNTRSMGHFKKEVQPIVSPEGGEWDNRTTTLAASIQQPGTVFLVSNGYQSQASWSGYMYN